MSIRADAYCEKSNAQQPVFIRESDRSGGVTVRRLSAVVLIIYQSAMIGDRTEMIGDIWQGDAHGST